MSLTMIDLGVDDWLCAPATWEAYTALAESRGEKGRPRYIFLDGRLTVVSPGNLHEALSARLCDLIHEIVVEFGVFCHPLARVTLLKSAGSKEGTEADATYYFTNFDRVVGKRTLVMGVDPPPDLVVEVVVSHPEHDALEAYRRFGVREVWVAKESGLEFLVLGADGRYEASPVSACLPFLRADELVPWVFRDDPPSATRVLQLFRAWAAETLAPRHRPEAAG